MTLTHPMVWRITGVVWAWVAMWAAAAAGLHAAEPLRVTAAFEGGSAKIIGVDQTTRTVRFMPGGDALRGWPCWWYLRVDGLEPGQPLTLRLQASSATRGERDRPLAAAWAMPTHATWSSDGRDWHQSEPGTRDGECMVYRIVLPGTERTAFVAWGPPFTPTMAAEFLAVLTRGNRHAWAETLCRSREGRPVPLLRVRQASGADLPRFGIWVQARQHAWESGSSWVARGFAEWCVSDAAEAAWLRQHADIFIVPIMDVDNAATGNGGKDAEPWDHNRDWSDQPRWAETAAAQRLVAGLAAQGRMDVFLDLHNPAPGDPSFFYLLDPQFLAPETVALRDLFVAVSSRRIATLKPPIPLSSQPKLTGPTYHPRWREISANWVAMHGNQQTVSLCLETVWNSPASTTAGYRAVGAALAAATQEYLATRPAKRKPDEGPGRPFRGGLEQGQGDKAAHIGLP